MRNKDESMYEKILQEIKENPETTEIYLANKYGVSERTIRRYIKDLKSIKKIILIIDGKDRFWKIL